MTYQRPSRPQSEAWKRAVAWWKSLPTHRRVEYQHLLGKAMAGIVAYHQRGGR